MQDIVDRIGVYAVGTLRFRHHMIVSLALQFDRSKLRAPKSTKPLRRISLIGFRMHTDPKKMKMVGIRQ